MAIKINTGFDGAHHGYNHVLNIMACQKITYSSEDYFEQVVNNLWDPLVGFFKNPVASNLKGQIQEDLTNGN